MLGEWKNDGPENGSELYRVGWKPGIRRQKEKRGIFFGLTKGVTALLIIGAPDGNAHVFQVPRRKNPPMSATVATPSPVYVQTQFVWDESTLANPRVTQSVEQRRPVSTSRRGACEHVGGALVSVLGSYGIGLDELLDEIERQKALLAKG